MQILNSLRIAQSARYLGTTQFAHNERGERTSLTDPAGNTVDYTHNAFGEQTALNNRRSQTYQFTFDANGNPLATVTPLGHTTTRAYNDLGQVESVGEASGQTTTFVYDDAGRVESQTDPAGTITTSFDDNGNPLTVTEGGDVLTRTFDEMDRVATYTDAAGNQIAYQRDLNGNLTQITYPGGETVTYTYDAHDRLKTVSDWSGRTTTYTWDAAGRLIGISRPNGTSRVNEYTDADDLDRFYVPRSEATTRPGFPKERTGPYGPGQSTLHAYARFGYDLDSRIDWRYRLPQPQEANLPSFDATYDIDNRVATWNGAPVTHDADGNMTSGPLPGEADFASYTFDARNRLTAVNGTSYQYDAEGNRIAKTTPEGTTNYVIDPHGDALPRVLIREKPDGTVTRYVYGIGLLYEVDESDVATYYHFDQSGSTIAMTDTSGSVTDRVEYSPFGAITHREGTTDTPYLYAGQFGIQQEANGLLYMRARYYSPELQRFINGDPARFDGGLNWYAYANNSPLMYVDPDGELPILAVPLLMHAARIVATAAIRRAAPIAARFIARAATRSAAATARNARFAGRATANLGRSAAIQARNLGRAGLNQANLQTFRINQALRNPSPALRSALKVGAFTTITAGFANEFRRQPLDTRGLTSIDLGNSPIGATIASGVTLFDLGGLAGKTTIAAPSALESFNQSINRLSQSIGSTFSTPSFDSTNFK